MASHRGELSLGAEGKSTAADVPHGKDTADRTQGGSAEKERQHYRGATDCRPEWPKEIPAVQTRREHLQRLRDIDVTIVGYLLAGDSVDADPLRLEDVWNLFLELLGSHYDVLELPGRCIGRCLRQCGPRQR